MNQSKIKRLGRRLALITALTALMAAATASAAAASVTVTPNSGIAWTGAEVTVSGVAPAGATDVAVVLCNVDVTPGIACDEVSATPGFRSVEDFEGPGILIPVQRGPWLNADYTKGTPPKEGVGSTTCYSAELEAGSNCAVLVSFYDLSEGFAQLGVQPGALSFK